ncbi:GNAT family N-acetyltransferase [Caenispirillum bisanense]|uniref:Acetyltransferase, GNAT family n=1 Tax=Caenispirillum bisanense TaxID=414052 RepID=A0A286G7M8_9PROT|nr:GNAT family N-acetyltransferase [Caenispirillum bisanense]SOD91216.1 Acetyltransferase, GNAT family [Caenispirillum bisanense]
MHPDAVTLRRARPDDIKALRTLQTLSLLCLGTSHYAPEQIAAFITHVGTMDDHLVEDGGCLIAEIDGRMAGCGGWSLRTPGYAAVMGGAQAPARRETPVVRSVFVHPGAARRGVGRRIMAAVEAEMLAAGHDRAVLTATLPGVAFYTALGWRPMRAVRLALPGGHAFRGLDMAKLLRRPQAGHRADEPAVPLLASA